MVSDDHLSEPPAGERDIGHLDTIRLVDVNFSDTTYRISTRTDATDLVRSIQRIGMLVPPLLKPAGENLQIVSGFLRLKACRQLGMETTHARLVPERFNALDCAHCAVAINIAGQRLTKSLSRGGGIATAVLDQAVHIMVH